jgi:hypothetical protein
MKKEVVKLGIILVFGVLFSGFLQAQSTSSEVEVISDAKQVVVYHRSERFAGWPANNGAWIFKGDEILVGFTEGPYKLGEGHNIGHPQSSWLARSKDGGKTWETWDPNNFVGDFGNQPTLKRVQKPINFKKSKFALRGVGTAYHGASDPRGHFFYTYDAGDTWNGPFGFGDLQNLPQLTKYWDEVELTPRTDYVVTGKHEMILFMSARPKGKFGMDRLFCVKTTDGGKNFKFLGWIVKPYTANEQDEDFKVPLFENEEENPWSTQCRAVMSESFLMDDGSIITVMRRKYSSKNHKPKNWVDAYVSKDGGKSWDFHSKVGDAGDGNGNPPALAKTGDGRFCAVYGERTNGTMRVSYSTDEGHYWSKPKILFDGFYSPDMEYNDLGYPRVLRRKDGKMVAIYYYSTKDAIGQLHATIWQP